MSEAERIADLVNFLRGLAISYREGARVMELNPERTKIEGIGKKIDEAANALSTPPPAEGVTEEMVNAGTFKMFCTDCAGLEPKDQVRKILEAALASKPIAGVDAWRCFHCDEVFTDRNEAFEHFGYMEDGASEQTACQLTRNEKGLVGLLREAWAELRGYHEEDTALIREVHGLGAKSERERREWGDKEYAKGLADGCVEKPTPIAAPLPNGIPVIKIKDGDLWRGTDHIAWREDHVLQVDLAPMARAALRPATKTGET